MRNGYGYRGLDRPHLLSTCSPIRLQIRWEVEANKLSKYKSSLIDIKLALEKTSNELSKIQAKLRMLEGELRHIIKMGWWKRLFWR